MKEFENYQKLLAEVEEMERKRSEQRRKHYYDVKIVALYEFEEMPQGRPQITPRKRLERLRRYEATQILFNFVVEEGAPTIDGQEFRYSFKK